MELDALVVLAGERFAFAVLGGAELRLKPLLFLCLRSRGRGDQQAECDRHAQIERPVHPLEKTRGGLDPREFFGCDPLLGHSLTDLKPENAEMSR